MSLILSSAINEIVYYCIVLYCSIVYYCIVLFRRVAIVHGAMSPPSGASGKILHACFFHLI